MKFGRSIDDDAVEMVYGLGAGYPHVVQTYGSTPSGMM